MIFWLGTHQPNRLERTDVPLFVSAVRLRRRKSLPVAKGEWRLDSGGFSELSLHGEWTATPQQTPRNRRPFSEVTMITTEQEWLACEDPKELMHYLTHQRIPVYRDGVEVSHIVQEYVEPMASKRKFRLFCCACARARAVAGSARLSADYVKVERSDGNDDNWSPEPRSLAETWCKDGIPDIVTLSPADKSLVLRDVFGNPFRPTPFGLMWTDERHLNSDAYSVALAAYGERMEDGTLDPVRLSVLADALEEFGCDDWRLLSHLRGEEQCPVCMAGPCRKKCTACHEGSRPLRGKHYLGCWALDLVLGKE